MAMTLRAPLPVGSLGAALPLPPGGLVSALVSRQNPWSAISGPPRPEVAFLRAKTKAADYEIAILILE